MVGRAAERGPQVAVVVPESLVVDAGQGDDLPTTVGFRDRGRPGQSELVERVLQGRPARRPGTAFDLLHSAFPLGSFGSDRYHRESATDKIGGPPVG